MDVFWTKKSIRDFWQLLNFEVWGIGDGKKTNHFYDILYIGITISG
jgi:hypothetical protein